MRTKIKITLTRVFNPKPAPSDGSPVYVVDLIVGAVTVAGQSDVFRVGDKLSEKQAEDLSTVARYEVTVRK